MRIFEDYDEDFVDFDLYLGEFGDFFEDCEDYDED